MLPLASTLGGPLPSTRQTLISPAPGRPPATCGRSLRRSPSLRHQLTTRLIVHSLNPQPIRLLLWRKQVKLKEGRAALTSQRRPKASSGAPVQPPAQPNASSAATAMTFAMLCSSLNAFADAEPVLKASAPSLEFEWLNTWTDKLESETNSGTLHLLPTAEQLTQGRFTSYLKSYCYTIKTDLIPKTCFVADETKKKTLNVL